MIAENQDYNKKLNDAELKNLWKEYKKSQIKNSEGDIEMRNKISENYLDLVEKTAKRIYSKFPSVMELDELFQDGYFGLIDAIEKYNPLKKNKFETYGNLRISGEIIDGLRRRDWVPRLARERQARLSEIEGKFLTVYGYSPTLDEMIEFTSFPEKELEMLIKIRNVKKITSLSKKLYETDTGKTINLTDLLEDNSDNPRLLTEKKDLRRRIEERLTEEEKEMISLCYYDGLTVVNASKKMGLDPNGKQRVHSTMIRRLRIRFPRKEEFIFKPI